LNRHAEGLCKPLNRGTLGDKPTKGNLVRCLRAIISVSIQTDTVGLAVSNMLLWTHRCHLQCFFDFKGLMDVSKGRCAITYGVITDSFSGISTTEPSRLRVTLRRTTPKVSSDDASVCACRRVLSHEGKISTNGLKRVKSARLVLRFQHVMRKKYNSSENRVKKSTCNVPVRLRVGRNLADYVVGLDTRWVVAGTEICPGLEVTVVTGLFTCTQK
jgi:hypothetical protein